jgi:hypothetical protein
MQNTAQEVYTQVIRDLSPTERLRLATLILNDLVEQKPSEIEDSDTWSQEDCEDIANFSLQYASASLYASEEI